MRKFLYSLLFVLILISPSYSNADSYLNLYCSQYKDPNITEQKINGLIEELKSGDLNKRAMAADKLSCYGQMASSAIPLMIQLFNESNGEARSNMISAVAHFGEIAVPELTKALTNEDKDIRRSTCIALREIGPPAMSAIPDLKKLLSEPGYDVSLAAERAIKSIENKKISNPKMKADD